MDVSNHALITLLLGTLGLGGATTVVTEAVKRLGVKLNVIEREAASVIHFLSVALSGVATVAQYIIQLHSALPPQVLALTGTSIYGVSQLAYKWSQSGLGFLSSLKVVNVKNPVDSVAVTPLAVPASAEPDF